MRYSALSFPFLCLTGVTFAFERNRPFTSVRR